MAFVSCQLQLIFGVFLLTITTVSNGSWIDWGHHHHHDHGHDKHSCGAGFPPGLHCPSGNWPSDYTKCCWNKNGHGHKCCKPTSPTTPTPGKMQPWAIVLLVLAILFVVFAVVLLLCACCSCCYWAGKRRRREYVVIRDQPYYGYSYSAGGYRV